MVIVPQTNIILLKTPMELSDNNQLTWSNLTEQFNYFYSLPKITLDEATYQRKEGVIRFPTNDNITFEDLLKYNYCMYQNEAYNDKWFYAYIADITYVNDGMSTIKLETDVWNTWWSDINYKASFVEREHVNDDSIGLHTVPENVELGEFIINGSDQIDVQSNSCYICMGVTKLVNGFPDNILNRTYNKIYSGLSYIIFSDATSCSKMIKVYDDAGIGEDIYDLFMIPSSLAYPVNWYTADIGNETDIHFATLLNSSTATSMISNSQVSINTTLDSYTPKNNKLFTFPYNYLYVSNNAGNDVVYKYEDFTNNTPAFNVDGAITLGCSIKLYPLNYKRKNTSVWKTACYNYGIVGFKYPTCSWKSDSYTNWITQNSLNIGIDTAKNLITAGAGLVVASTGAFSGGVGSAVGLGMMGSAINGIANSITQVHEASFMPNQAKGNVNGGDVTLANSMSAFVYYKMSVRSEYAKIIDDYFTMYGYKVNSLKIPNIRGRLNWNYVKTIGCNFTGDIPQLDLEKIKKLFDNGITLWHHTNTFLDYSQSNTIVS